MSHTNKQTNFEAFKFQVSAALLLTGGAAEGVVGSGCGAGGVGGEGRR